MKERFGQAIKAIVVEDEEKIGWYISNKIESLDASVSVEGLAQNGAEALALIEKCRPQVVFTDITMPVMDGLELAAAIKHNYPGIVVVIISGYSEFSYAQQAVRHGVFNYILKPIEEEELSDTLYDIRKNLAYGHLGEERQVLYSDADMFRQTADMEYILFSICVGNLIYDMQDTVLAEFYREQTRLIPWKRIMEEVCGDGCRWYLADEEAANQKIAGFQFKKGEAASIDALSHTLLRKIGQDTGMAVHICRPKEAVPHEELWNTAKYLRHGLQQGLVVGCTQILTGEEEGSQGKSVMEIVKMRLGSDIKNYFRTMERKDLTGDILSVLSYMIQNRTTQVNTEKVCLYILKLLEFSDGHYDAEFLKELQLRLQRGIGLAVSEEELLACMTKCSREINGYMNRVCEENIQERLLKYVDAHFLTMENLKEAADAIGYNYTYLSRLFKKVTGMPANKYITDKKIYMAKELLAAHPEMVLEDVSGMCGYRDTSYFIRVFKKQTGMSPGEYRAAKDSGKGLSR